MATEYIVTNGANYTAEHLEDKRRGIMQGRYDPASWPFKDEYETGDVTIYPLSGKNVSDKAGMLSNLQVIAAAQGVDPMNCAVFYPKKEGEGYSEIAVGIGEVNSKMAAYVKDGLDAEFYVAIYRDGLYSDRSFYTPIV